MAFILIEWSLSHAHDLSCSSIWEKVNILLNTIDLLCHWLLIMLLIASQYVNLRSGLGLVEEYHSNVSERNFL